LIRHRSRQALIPVVRRSAEGVSTVPGDRRQRDYGRTTAEASASRIRESADVKGSAPIWSFSCRNRCLPSPGAGRAHRKGLRRNGTSSRQDSLCPGAARILLQRGQNIVVELALREEQRREVTVASRSSVSCGLNSTTVSNEAQKSWCSQRTFAASHESSSNEREHHRLSVTGRECSRFPLVPSGISRALSDAHEIANVARHARRSHMDGNVSCARRGKAASVVGHSLRPAYTTDARIA
jgi:hypothetical protein